MVYNQRDRQVEIYTQMKTVKDLGTENQTGKVFRNMGSIPR